MRRSQLAYKATATDEIWEEIGSLKGKELDEYLVSIGLNPQELLMDYSKAVAAATTAPKRARFEEACRRIRQMKTAGPGKSFPST